MPSKALTWYPTNDTVLDTGTGIDVRALTSTATGVMTQTQSWTATHQNDNVNRHWDPDTGGVTDGSDVNVTLLRRGWAIPTGDLAAGDGRCRTLLPAQTVTVHVTMQLTWSGSPAGGSTPQAKASLWRYDPATDTGVLVAAGAVLFPNAWGGLGGESSGAAQTAAVPIAVPDTIVEAGEVLLVQWGVGTQTLSNPVLGTVTFTGNLRIGLTTTSRVVFAQALRLECAHAGSGDVRSTATLQPRAVAVARPVAAAGRTGRGVLVVYASKSVTASGGAARTVEVARTPTTVAAAGVGARSLTIAHAAGALGAGVAGRSLVVVRARKTVAAAAQSAAGRRWEAVRYAHGDVAAGTGFGRTVIFVRYAQATAKVEADPDQARISLPLSDLPTSDGSGGSVTIKKFFPILD